MIQNEARYTKHSGNQIGELALRLVALAHPQFSVQVSYKLQQLYSISNSSFSAAGNLQTLQAVSLTADTKVEGAVVLSG